MKPEPGSILGEINALADLIGKPRLTLKLIDAQVAKVHIKRNLLAQIEVPLNYAGEHWITVSVYGERDSDETFKPILSDMRCFVNDEPADNFLPETLKDIICSEILRGDHES